MKSLQKYLKSAKNIIKAEGWHSFFRSLWWFLLRNHMYEIWWNRHKVTKKELETMKRKAQELKDKLLISIIMPVYNPQPDFLKQAIESVLKQVYPYWKLCICDDASTDPKVQEILRGYAEQDERIQITFHTTNKNISEASNSALKMAEGEYVGLMDHDDLLPPNALYEVVEAIQKENAPDIIYTDEDKIDEKQSHNTPFFKPNWSPDLLLAMMYFGHFTLYKKSMIDEVHGFRKGYEGSQDYDLALRITERTEKILHIPKVLYHWRQHAHSTARTIDTKSYAPQNARKALESALKRRNIAGVVQDGLWFGSYRIKRKIENHTVSIIIPFRDQKDILERCIRSIREKSRYQHYELILVNNQSQESLDGLEKHGRIIDYPHVFNFSKINNTAVAKAKGDVLLFLNNDIEVIEPEWLEAMLEHAIRPEIACIGPKLLYPNGTVQHAGVVIGIAGACSHAFRHVSDSLHGYMGLKDVIRNVSAVTGACLMIERKKFDLLQGFNENFEIAYQDIDLCLRALEKGYKNIYTPYAKLIHFESMTRKGAFGKQDTELFIKHWGQFIEKGDPYYNPNLSLRREDFRIEL